MNEEIKKDWHRMFGRYCDCSAPSGTGFVCETCHKDINFGINPDEVQWNWLDKKLQQAYLQGAKDMIDVVKMNRIDPNKTDVAMDEFTEGYHKAVDDIEHKAQQFIDSLEGKDE